MKSLMKSRYIKITAVLVIVVAMALYLVLDLVKIDYGKIARKVQEEANRTPQGVTLEADSHESGGYILMVKSGGYVVEDRDGDTLYKTDCISPWLPNKEGCIVEGLEDGRQRVFNFYTGETEYITEAGEEISKISKDLTEPAWIIEGYRDSGTRPKQFSNNAWERMDLNEFFYLLDENYQVAGEGYLFSYMEAAGEYVYGSRFENVDYSSKKKLDDKGFWGCDAQCVMNTKGEILYEGDAETSISIDSDMKAVMVFSEEPVGWTYIGLEGKDKGRVLKEEWQR